jgi:hypothetical protein
MVYNAGFKPWVKNDDNTNGDGLSDWAANFEYGYITSTNVHLDPKKQGWQKISLMIESGGDLNPRGLPLKSVFVHAILSPPRWDSCDLNNGNECNDPWNPANNNGGTIPWKCCSAAGKVYFDNFQLRPFEPYYLLDNYKLEKGACNGLVSLEEGCVLFRDEKIKENYYNSIATYAKSKDLKGALVKPVDCSKPPFNLPPTQTQPSKGISWLKKIFSFLFKTATAQTQTTAIFPSCDDPPYKDTDYCKYCFANGQTKNDTNLILKVSSTRVCGEWLHCEKFEKVWRKEINDYITFCRSPIRCNRQTGQGDQSTCVSLVQVPNEVLTKQKYQQRDVSWFSLEPASFTFYKMRPLEYLTRDKYKIDLGNEKTIEELMVTSKFDEVDVGISGKCKNSKDCPPSAICLKKPLVGQPYSKSGQLYSISDNENEEGFCVIPLTTQAYPEKDAPFHPQVLDIFPNVNVCSRAKVFGNCDRFNSRQEVCEDHGCVWKDCERFSNESECREKGCVWVDMYNYCTNCAGIFSRLECENAGCIWESRDGGGFCLNGCENYGAQDGCETAGCIWKNGQNGQNGHCTSYCVGRPSKDTFFERYYGRESNVNFLYFGCQGNYRKAEYGTGGATKKYFNIKEGDFQFQLESWPGVCLAGKREKIGQPCAEDDDCSTYEIKEDGSRVSKNDGVCEKLTKETIYAGRLNFCLLKDTSLPKIKTKEGDKEVEKDYLNSCLIWYPFSNLLAPNVKTQPAVPTATTATLYGRLYDFGASSSARVWFKYKKEGEERWQETEEETRTQLGVFSVTITGLTPETTYQFQACASHPGGENENCGGQLEFKTTERPPFDFTLSLDSTSGAVVPGGDPVSTTLTVTQTDPESIPQSVSFSSTPPNNITVSFNPSSCTPAGGPPQACSSTVRISASGQAQPGDYRITITGTYENVSRSVTYTLTVGSKRCQGTPAGCFGDEECTRPGGKEFSCQGVRRGVCGIGGMDCLRNDECPECGKTCPQGGGPCPIQQGICQGVICSEAKDCAPGCIGAQQGICKAGEICESDLDCPVGQECKW